MFRIDELIVYREYEQEQEQDQVLNDMAFIVEETETMGMPVSDLRGLYFSCIHKLTELAGTYGFEGNLWHSYLTWLLVNNENVFSHASEIRGEVDGSINALVEHDYEIFRELYALNFEALEEKLGAHCFFMIADYVNAPQSSKVFNERIRDRICELSEKLAGAKDVHEFKEDMTSFYKDFGVGKLGLHKAFRVAHDEDGVQIVPITKIAHVHLDDLVGYELAKKKLIENTEAFVQGRKANNCLLFGDAGTGKSSSIKGILNEYYDQGLRIIEVYKHQFQDLNDVIAQVKNRNYRFIIYMDDLSFEEFEIEYKFLKAVIEGGVETKPENILIYATSNRRHLIKENWSDRNDVVQENGMHQSDTMEEKLSLVNRFGVKINYSKPMKKEFNHIVLELAHKNNIEMDEKELLLEANKWELSHGGTSGRTAQQFINYILGLER